MADAATVLLLVATGILAGTISALMGIGGGLVMVPALHYGWGLAWHEATALSLLAIVIQAPMGIWRHHRRGAVSWRWTPPLVLGGAAGVVVGAATDDHIPVPLLRLLFAVVLAYAAVRMFRPLAPAPRRLGRLPVFGIGLVAGIAAKWLGIGGGMVTVPVLVLAGVGAHVAVATSLVPVWTNAAVATVLNTRSGLLGPAALALGVGALGGAWIGVRIAHALPEARLRRVLGALLLLGALWMATTSGAWSMEP